MARILILHALDASQPMRRTIWQRSLAGPRHAPHHEWLFHHAFTHPRHLPRNLDLVILDTTFLCHRWSYMGRLVFQRFAKSLRALSCPKIALPQDDYDHHAILDDWLTAFGVDVVFTPLDAFYDRLCPKTVEQAEIKHAYTGYVDPEDLVTPVSPWDSRHYDVVYRAAKLPEWFGAVGHRKANLGTEFETAAIWTGLYTNLNGPPFMGSDWARFLSSSRFTIGSPSGASVADPDGSIRRRVTKYKRSHPHANFFEVRRACFPISDGVPMTAIGPRMWEAATAHVGLVLTPGDYEPFRPHVHYYEVQSWKEAAQWMLDHRTNAPQSVQAAKDLATSPCYSYRRFVLDLLTSVGVSRGKESPVESLPLRDVEIAQALGAAPTTKTILVPMLYHDPVRLIGRLWERLKLVGYVE